MTLSLPSDLGYVATLQQGQASLLDVPENPQGLTQLLIMIDIQAQMQQQAATQAQVLAAQATYQFADWYDSDAISLFSDQTSTAVNAVATSIARQTSAYTASMVTWGQTLKGRPQEFHKVYSRAEEAAETGDALRKGDTTHAGVYGRIADAYRWQQHLHDKAAAALAAAVHPKPPALQSPKDAAVQRAQSIAGTDIQLAARNQAMKSLQTAADQGLIIGYRRLLHPELDRGGVCGLCIAASTRIYHVGQLMPLHTDCHCTPIPVTSTHDPGAVINDRDLGTLYQAAGGTDRASLEHTHFQVVPHGENGPTLIPAGAPHRTPGMVRKATKRRPSGPDSQARKVRQLTTLHDSLARSLKRIDDELLPADPGTWSDYRQTLATRVADLEHQLKGAAA